MALISLQDTLAEFYKEELGEDSVTFLSFRPTSYVDLTKTIVRNKRYLMQQWRVPTNASLAPIVNIVLMVQRVSWMAGGMPVILLKTDEQVEWTKCAAPDLIAQDLNRTMAQLRPKDRWKTSFCADWDEVRAAAGDTKLFPLLPCDMPVDIPQLFDPDMYFDLLTKRYLAKSGIPTPSAQVIDFVPPDEPWTDASIHQALDHCFNIIRAQKLPFVIKSNSSAGGTAVYLIKSYEDQTAAEESIYSCLCRELPLLTKENAHLNPLSLVITEYLPKAGASLNFYVSRNGESRWSSCTYQIQSPDNIWLGSGIIYSKQDRLFSQYSDIMLSITKFLHAKGYFGPAGADIMFDHEGNQLVVDLSPRTTGSFILGNLKPHFHKLLGLDEAQVLRLLEIPASRDIFEASFRVELNSGLLIILSWYSDQPNKRSYAHFAVGGKDRSAVVDLTRKIEAWTPDR